MGKFQEGLYDELSLHVRQTAWLNTAPQRPENDKSKEPQLTRLERMRRDRRDELYEPEMPPVEAGGYLIGYLFEVGPAQAGGTGTTPISHQEIMAWQELAGMALQPWEARFLRRLSCDYVAASHKAEKRGATPPWQSGQDDRPAVDPTKSAIRALAGL